MTSRRGSDDKFSPVLRTDVSGAAVGRERRMCHRNVTSYWHVEATSGEGAATTAAAAAGPSGGTDSSHVSASSITSNLGNEGSGHSGASTVDAYTSPVGAGASETNELLLSASQLQPSARFGHTAVVDDRNGGSEATMVLFGGRDATTYNNEVWVYDLVRHRWKRPVVTTDISEYIATTAAAASGVSGSSAGVSSSLDQQGSSGEGEFNGADTGGDDAETASTSSSGTMMTTHSTSTGTDGSGSGSGGISHVLDIAGPSPRAGHTAVITEDRKMIVFGGGVDSAHCTNDVWELDLNTMRWTQKLKFANPEEVPTPRKGHTAIRHRSSMVVFGGNLETPGNEIWRFETRSKGGRWSVAHTTGNVPVARQYHTAELDEVRNSMLVFGGKGNGQFLNDLHELNLESNVWRRIEGRGDVPSSRMCSSSLFRNGVLCVFNGGATSYYADCFEFDRETEVWRRLAPGPVACTRPTTVIHRNRVTMFGGCAAGHTFLADVVGMDLAAPSLKEVCRGWLRAARGRIDWSAMPENLRVYVDSCE